MISENHEYQDKVEKRCLDVIKKNINEKDCFGLSNEQYIELIKWLNEAKPNFDNNKFPDFIFNEGFIEHFAVTSSLENRKGAKQKRESLVFKHKSETNFLSNLDNSEEILLSHSYGRKFDEHSYLYFLRRQKTPLKHMYNSIV